MDKYFIPLEEGKFYHIYNQGNNRENVFYNDGNYAYFLRKLDVYLSDFVEIYAFCLLPNHFHILVRIKALEELETVAMEKFSVLRHSKLQNRQNIQNRHSKSRRLEMSEMQIDSEIYSEFLSEQFRRFFMSYSKSINKQEGRVGSLFRKNFKRKEITSLPYLQNTIVYIHRNPVHHGFDTDFATYTWSSYNRIVEEKITKLKKHEVLEWFGGKENYRDVHNCDVEDDIE